MRRILVLFLAFIKFNLIAQTTEWVKSFGGVESDKGISIGTDSLGFIYISGFYNNEATFGSITLSNSNMGWGGNNKENFIAKLDSTGNVLWAIPGGNQSGGCCDDRALGMHVTPGGDVFITGTFWSSYRLGVNGAPGTINVTTGLNSHDNSLLAKIDTDGNPVWAIGFGGDNTSGGCPFPIYDADDHSYDVKVDDDGFIYVTGFFSGYDADFDGFTISNPEWGNDCQPMGYIGKLDSLGNWIWVDKFDGIKDQRGSRDNRLSIDEFSNIYVVGGFQNRGISQTGTFGPFQITSNGEWDAFIFKMDKDGNWLWVKNIGSNKTDRANSVAVDIDNDVYITGEYRNPMIFVGANASNGTDTLSHKQKRDVFVAKCNGNGDWLWAKRARTEGTDKPYQMSVDNDKQVFLCGTMKGTAIFSSDLSVSPQIVADTSASAWIAQLDGSTNTGDWVWAKMAGCSTDDDDRAGDICHDVSGNVYAVGFFEDLANFDGIVLDATNRKKDIFVWKVKLCYNHSNSYDTIFSPDSMVFNSIDTGIFINSSYTVNGCDTAFIDSIVHQKLGVQINYNINNAGSASFSINGVVHAMPYSNNYWSGENIIINATVQPNWLFNQWKTNFNTILPNINANSANFIANVSDSCILKTRVKPPVQALISGNDTICDNKEATIDVYFNGTPPYTFTYAVNGVNQDPITTNAISYTIYTYEPGIYTLSSFSDDNESGSISGSAIVTHLISPETSFRVLPDDSLTINDTKIAIVDNSKSLNGKIVNWDWSFGDGNTLSYTDNDWHDTIFYEYPNSKGTYQISLIVHDNKGCADTTQNLIVISDLYTIYIPNSFSPDLDGKNDRFCLVYSGIREATFAFNIYDRFSNLVYSTNNIQDLTCENGWDGKHYKTGKDLPMGTYIYQIYYQDFEGWKHQETSKITLFR